MYTYYTQLQIDLHLLHYIQRLCTLTYLSQPTATLASQQLRFFGLLSSGICSMGDLSTAGGDKSRSTIAIVRGVPGSFCSALAMETPSSPVNLERAREQHATYVKILRGLVQEVIELSADEGYPDCPFIEDTAVVIGNRALITRPGAVSRQGEELAIREALTKLGINVSEVEAPGSSIDGGDILYASGILFAGKSRRTNDGGIAALAKAFPNITVHSIEVSEGLHLKSGLSSIAPNTLAVEDNKITIAMLDEVQRKSGGLFTSMKVAGPGAANTLLLGDTLLCSATLGTNLAAQYGQHVRSIIPVDISEFHKVDGGLTCLSIIINP